MAPAPRLGTGPYREQKPPEQDAVSPLELLAKEGEAQRQVLKRQVEDRTRDERRRRIEAALFELRVPVHESLPFALCSTALLVSLGILAFNWAVLPWGLLALVFGAALAALVRRERQIERERPALIEAELQWPSSLPFPVVGYETWLASDFGIVHVHLRNEIEPKLATSAVFAIAPAARTKWEGERHLAIGLPSKYLWGGDDETTLGGDPALLHALIERVLVPLHSEVGIERVRLAEGYLLAQEQA